MQTNAAEARERKRKDADADADAYDERFGKMHPESTETEVVFDEMYPDREDVEALGDDVRVGPRRVFKGAIGWKTERDDRDGKKVSSVSSTVRFFFFFLFERTNGRVFFFARADDLLSNANANAAARIGKLSNRTNPCHRD